MKLIAVPLTLAILGLIAALRSDDEKGADVVIPPDDKKEGKVVVPPDDKKKGKAVIPKDKKPSGRPPAIKRTFDWDNVFAVRWQFILLGYPNEHLSATVPKGPEFKQFQRDYNSVSAACLNDAIFMNVTPGGKSKVVCNWTGLSRFGKLRVDGDVGNNTKRAVEVVKRLQAKTGRQWKQLVSMARSVGF